jgi:DNA ligase-1
MTKFQPMLASPVDLAGVVYPVLCSPKYDGIRCIIKDGVALSRTLKPIPNSYIQKMLSSCPTNLDGELIIKNKTFNQIQSAVMNGAGEPDFTYVVFDVINDFEYSERVEDLLTLELPACCETVIPLLVENEEELLAYETTCLAENYEGIMIRSPDGPYKFGRSTPKQGYLSKLKRFQDSEAVIIGFEELQHNMNEATVDARGHTKRSHKKAGMVDAGTLGAFVVRDGTMEFKVATGLTAEERQEYWDSREQMIGKLVKYKCQPSGAKDLPRFPTFLGIRHPDDL